MHAVNEHLETTYDGYQRFLTGYQLFSVFGWRFGRFVSTLYDKNGPVSHVHYWRRIGAIT